MADGGDIPDDKRPPEALALLEKPLFEIGELVFYRLTRYVNSWWPARVIDVELQPILGGPPDEQLRVYTLAGIGPSMNLEDDLWVEANEVRPFLNEPQGLEVDDTTRIMRWHEFDRLANDRMTALSPPLLALFRRDLARGEAIRELGFRLSSDTSLRKMFAQIRSQAIDESSSEEHLEPHSASKKKEETPSHGRRAVSRSPPPPDPSLYDAGKKSPRPCDLSATTSPKSQFSSPKKEETLVSSKADIRKARATSMMPVYRTGELVFYRITSYPRSWWPARIRNFALIREPTSGSAVRYRLVYRLTGIGPRGRTSLEQMPTNLSWQWRLALNGPVRLAADEISRIVPWSEFDCLASDPNAAPPSQCLELFRRDLARGDAVRRQQSFSSGSSSGSSNTAPTASPLSIIRLIRGVIPDAWQNVPSMSDNDARKLYSGAERPKNILPAHIQAGLAAQERRGISGGPVQKKLEEKPKKEETPSPDSSAVSRSPSASDSPLVITESSESSSGISAATSHPKCQFSLLKKEETPVSGEAAVSEARIFEIEDLVFYQLTDDPILWWPAQVVGYTHVTRAGFKIDGQPWIRQVVGYNLLGIGPGQRTSTDEVRTSEDVVRYFLEVPNRLPMDAISEIIPWHEFDSLATDPNAAPRPGLLKLFRRDLARGEAIRRQQGFSSTSSLLTNLVRGITPPRWDNASSKSHRDPSMLDGAERPVIETKPTLGRQQRMLSVMKNFFISRAQVSPKKDETLGSGEAAVTKSPESTGITATTVSPKSRFTSPKKEGTTGSTVLPSCIRSWLSSLRIPGADEAVSKRSQPTASKKIQSVYRKSITQEYLEPSLARLYRSPSSSPTSAFAKVPPKSSPIPSIQTQRFTPDKKPLKAKLSTSKKCKLNAPTENSEHFGRGTEEEKLMQSVKRFCSYSDSSPRTRPNPIPPPPSPDQQITVDDPVNSHGRERLPVEVPKAKLSTSKKSKCNVPIKGLECFDLAAEVEKLKESERNVPIKGSECSDLATELKKLAQLANRLRIDLDYCPRTPPNLILPPPSLDQPIIVDDPVNGHGRENPPVEVHDLGASGEEANRACCHDKMVDPVEESAETQPPLPSDQQMVVDDSMDGHGRERSPVEVQDSDVPKEKANGAGCRGKEADSADGSHPSQPPLPSDLQRIVESRNGNDGERSPGEEQKLDTPEEETNGAGDRNVDREVGESPFKKMKTKRKSASL